MREALEAAIDDDPDDPKNFAVYADWLIDQGDPIGEMIAQFVALETGHWERPAWIDRYPEVLRSALARLAIADPEAERTAHKLLRKNLPSPEDIQSQLDAMRDLPATPSRTRYIAKLETDLITPPMPSEDKLRNLVEQVADRAMVIAVGRFEPHLDLDQLSTAWSWSVRQPKHWRYGFVRRLELTSSHSSSRHFSIDRVLEHPAARFLVELVAIGSVDVTRDVVRQLANRVQPTLRELRLSTLDARSGIGYIGTLWNTMPRLERLGIHGGVDLGPFDAPRLRVFELTFEYLPNENIDKLVAANLPALESFKLRPRAVPREQLRRLLESMKAPALHTLALRDTPNIDDFVEDLAQMPLLRQLRVLDLSDNAMTDTGGLRIVRDADAFAHLEKLDLSRNRIRGPVADALKTLGPHVYAPLL